MRSWSPRRIQSPFSFFEPLYKVKHCFHVSLMVHRALPMTSKNFILRHCTLLWNSNSLEHLEIFDYFTPPPFVFLVEHRPALHRMFCSTATCSDGKQPRCFLYSALNLNAAQSFTYTDAGGPFPALSKSLSEVTSWRLKHRQCAADGSAMILITRFYWLYWSVTPWWMLLVKVCYLLPSRALRPSEKAIHSAPHGKGAWRANQRLLVCHWCIFRTSVGVEPGSRCRRRCSANLLGHSDTRSLFLVIMHHFCPNVLTPGHFVFNFNCCCDAFSVIQLTKQARSTTCPVNDMHRTPRTSQ